MKTQIMVENLKCSGCATTIRKELANIHGISTVEVDTDRGAVTVGYGDTALLDSIRKRLTHLGYPEVDSVHGIQKVAANAKSFVSCAVGRLSDPA